MSDAPFPGLPSPFPGAGGNRPPQKATRPAGNLYDLIQHPAVETFDREWQVMPEDAFYRPNLSPERPFRFNVGVHRVPTGNAVLVLDYRFFALRFQGNAAGDVCAVEPERMRTFFGFDLTVNAARPRDAAYQLQPVPNPDTASTPDTSPLAGLPRPPSPFNSGAAPIPSSAQPSSTSTLPFVAYKLGARQGPMSLVARPESQIEAACVIFRRLPIPLASIGAKIAGYQMPWTVLEEFLRSVQP